MSITDATGNVSTTWTEQDTVAFTAGSLNNIAACVTEVESKLKRGTLSSATRPTNTQVRNWLIFAKQELAEVKNFTFLRRYATATTASGTYIYGLPPDYHGGETSLRDTTNDRIIEIWPYHIFNTKYPDPTKDTNDEPIVATIKNLELWLYPVPNGSYTLELEYTRSGDDNTTTDFSWLPQIERYRCTHYAVWQGFLSIHMWNEARVYEAQWKEGLGKAIRSDGKRKWKSMQYQAISYQQWYAAKHTQQNETS